MSARRGAPYGLSSTAPQAAPSGIAENLAVVAAADTNDVLREQLEFLIEHTAGGTCGCSSCQRYAGVRAVLMQVFTDS